MKKLFLLLMLIFNIVITQSSASADEQFKTDFFVNAVKDKIELNWVKPYENPYLSTIVSFNINSDGTVSPVSILRSSENSQYDDSVVQAVYKAAPFESASVLKKPMTLKIFLSPSYIVANSVKNKTSYDKIVNVSNKNDYIDFSQYLENLQNKINTNWTPKSFSKERNNIVSIKIDKDGALSNSHVLEPSNDIHFDSSTLDAIAKSVPMDAFPHNITAPTTNVQLNFNYKKSKDKNGKEIATQYVKASVLMEEGSDKYTSMVETVLKENLNNKNTIFEKRLVFEAQINSLGKLKYVKIVEPSDSKMFNRSIYKVLTQSSFPQFPETINSDSITLKYELITGALTGIRIFPKTEDQ